MKKLIIAIVFYSILGILHAQSDDFKKNIELNDSLAQTLGTMTDARDGNTYRTIKIGNQWWFAENLNYYAVNGIKYLNNDSTQNAAKYGILYTWETAVNSCPCGWHLPTFEDWRYLEMELGFEQNEPVKTNNFYGTNEGDKLKDTVLWNTPNTNSNSSGFSALPGGHYAMEKFWGENTVAQFWADEKNSNEAWYRSLSYNNSGIHIFYQAKTDGYKSVRCTKDTVEVTGNYFGQEKPDTMSKPFGLSIISLIGSNEHTASFSPDGKSFYFTRDPDRKTFVMFKINNIWGQPIPADFIGREAIFSPDGSNLFFGDGDIWYMEKTQNGWSLPKRLTSEINTDLYEFYASSTSEGTLYFSRLINKQTKIFSSTLVNGQYSEAKELPSPINQDSSNNFHPFISPKGDFMIFNSDRAGGFGGADLFISYKDTNDNWKGPENLGNKINSPMRDICPTITPDGRYLFFTRNWQENDKWYGDIYWINTYFIKKMKNKQQLVE